MIIKIKIRIVILCLLLTAALYMGSQAIGSLQSGKQCSLPEEIYGDFAAKADTAQFFVKNNDGFVTVFKDKKFRKILTVTEIETAFLRKTDRAMLETGIPVADRTELLRLLEDLGS